MQHTVLSQSLMKNYSHKTLSDWSWQSVTTRHWSALPQKLLITRSCREFHNCHKMTLTVSRTVTSARKTTTGIDQEETVVERQLCASMQLQSPVGVSGRTKVHPYGLSAAIIELSIIWAPNQHEIYTPPFLKYSLHNLYQRSVEWVFVKVQMQPTQSKLFGWNITFL